ncbi:hypothetical protein CTAYLR_004406 [Chrysophaeum taylorii]|uniref:SGNH hydrolase-type esterase domain-containing protein n=1 Tax=Chrysophaeum taylorii TaxID=2483200 RepID=A0AAD7ULW1_9STRA|nr:hypothetical protein CTAYLR_004406 [Chrysophaeum taylorii]
MLRLGGIASPPTRRARVAPTIVTNPRSVLGRGIGFLVANAVREALTMRTVATYFWRAAASFATLTSVAVGQAVLHEQSYRPLPEINARKMGLELPNLALNKFKEKQRVISEKSKMWRRRLASWFDEPRVDVPRVRVLFLGDSLVTGVGGAPGEAIEGGPPLPRRVCRALADKLKRQVEWRALGVTGGDIGAMRRTLLPQLAQGDAKKYDVVVVMCGLNDFKHLARGQVRTPWAFRDELTQFLAEIKHTCGDSARVVLPALPVGLASFREPLRSYVIFIANQWDQQKQLLAQKSRQLLDKQRILFVDAVRPSPDTPDQTFVASDGVHPNEAGYELWARHIAKALYSNHQPHNINVEAS